MKTIQDHFRRASEVMPGGVNSSTRLNKARGVPFYASRGRGAYVWDIEGKRHIDMCCGHGAALLGHSHPAIKAAMKTATKIGYVPIFETEYHEELARELCRVIPCAERVRFCNSGSEGTLHLLRVCRAYTGKKKIIRIEGHFHGYHELIYIGGQPPEAHFNENRTRPYIESVGIPEEFAQLIIPIPYNDEEALKETVERYADEAAVMILEPVNYNSAGIMPQPGYLELARKLTREAGIVLFFDEIQSAFKKSIGGGQQDFGVTPDVCTLGKAVGGGMPLTVFAGKAEIMDRYKPVGDVQHSGTFNAHIISVLGGLAFIRELQKPGFYPKLQKLEKRFHEGIDRIIKDNDLNMVVPHHGARFNILLGRKSPAVRYEDTFCHDTKLFLKLLKEMWEQGVYFHDYGGGPCHHGYSIQHSEGDIDEVLNIMETVLMNNKEALRV
jgi:glutamate-1-semialdehyde 2,1-aminomutase